MSVSPTLENKRSSFLDRALDGNFSLNAEVLIYAALIFIAIFTRFQNLDSRVMSHDESLHTYYSWRFAEFQDYVHTPLMHGPLQFHLIAFSYFLFGDSDGSARIPVALIGVISIALIYVFRHWLGRWGAIIAALLMAISPFMLYYQRYVRNEAIIVLLALLMFWAVFKYFENRQARWLYLLSISLSLHFAAKETAFIYVAQLTVFLGLYLAWDFIKRPWEVAWVRNLFMIGFGVLLIGGMIAGIGFLGGSSGGIENIFSPVEPLDPTLGGSQDILGSIHPALAFGSGMMIAGFAIIAFAAIRRFGKELRTDFPALDLLIITATFTLPQLAAFPARLLGFAPLSSQGSILSSKTGIIVLVFILISVTVGLLWDWRRWLIAAGIFFGPFIILYTSLFTNGNGLSSGLVRSLEYWLEQQGERRGGQPWFYYLFLQIPMYEFLPAIGSFVALLYGTRSLRRRIISWFESKRKHVAALVIADESAESKRSKFPVIGFLGYWVVTAMVAYSFAGEKMPWLTVHIALPMILLAGWGLAKALQGIDLSALRSKRSWGVVLLSMVFFFSALRVLGSLAGANPPFQSSEFVALQATSAFLAALFISLSSLAAILFALKAVSSHKTLPIYALLGLGTLIFLTLRTSFRAAYQNSDLATEYLVYAHSAPGVKGILSQIEEFSLRTTDGLAVDIAYDNDVSWPYTWYLRNYDNAHYYGETPSRDLLNYPLVIAGNDNWTEVEKFLGNRYLSSEYIRMWWPNQGYYKLSWSSIEAENNSEQLSLNGEAADALGVGEYLLRVFARIKPFFLDAQVRSAIWQIWFNRDFSVYAQLDDREITLQNWSPSDKMRFYIRRDLAAMIWDVGTSAITLPESTFGDPYIEAFQERSAAVVIASDETEIGQLSSPRSIASAPDGSMFLVDSGNSRVLHLDSEGGLIDQWGMLGQSTEEKVAPLGTFFEPWGIAVAPDGSVYVADTWNHRIQHFTAQGEFLDRIGPNNEQGERIFWGPRALAIDSQGRIFVADTGNHRIAIFDQEWNLIGEIGEAGFDLGQFFEPVGVALDGDGRIYVADTWNQRIQVFEENDRNEFTYINHWAIDGWYGESLENKPYITVSSSNEVCISDPEGYRILCFTTEGEYLRGWGEYGLTAAQFGLPSGVAFTSGGDLWVNDSANNRVMLFELEPNLE